MFPPSQRSRIIVGSMMSASGSRPSGQGAAIEIEAGVITSISPASSAASGTLALAAFANAHDHGRGLRTLAFGAYDDALEVWIPTLGREPLVCPYLRAAVAFARMAEGGICATNHSHGYQAPDRALEEAEAVARAARDVGIRVAFAAPFMDRNLIVYGEAPEGLAEHPLLRAKSPPHVKHYLAEVEAIAAFENPYFSVQYCPVGPQWASDGALAAIAEASARHGRRVHMHLLETKFQREWADHAYPGGLIERFDELGLLSPRLSVAHGVHLRPDECALLAARGVIVSVNTTSNLRLRSGIAPMKAFVDAGLAFGLGLDAQAFEDDEDFWREMRLFWLQQRGFGIDDVVSPEQVFRAAQADGRRAVLGEDGGGVLAPGAPADILVLDYAAMCGDVLAPEEDPIAVLLNRATRKHIRQLIVAGRPIVENGRCVSVDLPELERELDARARAAWAAAPPDNAATASLKRAVRRYYGCGCHMGRAFNA